MRARFRFPAGAPGHDLAFDAPERVLVARTTADVLPVLAAADEAARAGLWAAGYVAYEAARAFDPAMRVHTPAPVPLAAFGIFTNARPLEAVGGADFHLGEWLADVSRAEAQDAVQRVRAAIARGEVYQVNYTFRLRASFAGDPLSLFDHLCAAQGAGWFACLELDDAALLSVSPELFFRRDADRVTTRPMKGTRRRGRWLAEDLARAEALHASAKDRAENLMIVDLLRNDLGRVARFGSVDVPALYSIERYPTVWQMTSTVTGELRDDVALPDLFRALFPSGSVTGAPKIAATAAIAWLEPSPRGAYCGAVGLVAPGGDAAFNVAIRTLSIDRAHETAEYGVGGGVTWDSSPAAEYDEALAKAAVLLRSRPAFELLETLRLERGAYARRDRHLARLSDSAEYFGLTLDPARVAAALDDHAAERRTGVWRARLLVDAAGTPRVESAPLEPVDGPVRVALADVRVRRDDVFLYHKTTRREVYEHARGQDPEAFDVLLANEDGELTEFTIGNLVVERDGRALTPPRDAGLLAGVFRQELLDAGRIAEATLFPHDLAGARAWLVNSVREWIPVHFE